ncbi:MAG: four-helix bundle copper-binding protein [Zunongwangia sp.]|uniref:four-helix bundle copper-binding protein n=1 Tax=Zunongwangia sp. TaxID=1965325 RepID=UPI003242BB7F|tara:strand:+ start:979 stop:1302 length:324 start_codon:yes stop_codon:yes gene_type:complete
MMRSEKLVNALANCVNHCNYCADACLSTDNIVMMQDCIRTDRVCAEVCNALANVAVIEGANITDFVKYCITICQECADECKKHEHKHCQDCATACETCVEACNSYLA